MGVVYEYRIKNHVKMNNSEQMMIWMVVYSLWLSLSFITFSD